LGGNRREKIMGKKQAIIGGLALIVAVGAVVVIRPAFRAKPPEPEKESPLPPSPQRKVPEGKQTRPSQTGPAQEGEKGAGPSQGQLSNAGGADSGASPFTSASWIMVQQRIDARGSTKETTTSKVWIKGDKRRVETFRTVGAWSGTALQPTSILFSDGEYEYSYYPAQQRMLRIDRDFGMEALSERWVRQRSEERVGSEVVDGKPCETYRLVNDVDVAGLATVKMEILECRWQGLVLKSVSRPIGSNTGETYITHLKDVRLNVPIPDEKFVLPKDVHVVDVDIPREALK
jgi:hypothetical protein